MAQVSLGMPSNRERLYITEDMFDAAMSERLGMEGEEMSSENNSENGSDNCDESDFEVTVIDETTVEEANKADVCCGDEEISFDPDIEVVETDCPSLEGEMKIVQGTKDLLRQDVKRTFHIPVSRNEGDCLAKRINSEDTGVDSSKYCLMTSKKGLTVINFGMPGKNGIRLDGSEKQFSKEHTNLSESVTVKRSVRNDEKVILNGNHQSPENFISSSNQRSKICKISLKDGCKQLVLSPPSQRRRLSEEPENGDKIRETNSLMFQNLGNIAKRTGKGTKEIVKLKSIIVNKPSHNELEPLVKLPMNILIPKHSDGNGTNIGDVSGRLINVQSIGKESESSKVVEKSLTEGSTPLLQINCPEKLQNHQVILARKSLLPKINFRYHPKNNANLPENIVKGAFTLVKKNNGYCMVADKDVIKSTADSINLPMKSPQIVRLKPVTSATVKCYINKKGSADVNKIPATELISSASQNSPAVSPVNRYNDTTMYLNIIRPTNNQNTESGNTPVQSTQQLVLPSNVGTSMLNSTKLVAQSGSTVIPNSTDIVRTTSTATSTNLPNTGNEHQQSTNSTVINVARNSPNTISILRNVQSSDIGKSKYQSVPVVLDFVPANNSASQTGPSSVCLTRVASDDIDLAKIKLNQLQTREVPFYKPPDVNEFFTCLDCGERFTQETSLSYHRRRRSILVQYWCRTCSCKLTMYNRCMFLAHIRSHNQSLKNIDMNSLTIKPLPSKLMLFSLADDGLSDEQQVGEEMPDPYPESPEPNDAAGSERMTVSPVHDTQDIVDNGAIDCKNNSNDSNDSGLSSRQANSHEDFIAETLTFSRNNVTTPEMDSQASKEISENTDADSFTYSNGAPCTITNVRTLEQTKDCVNDVNDGDNNINNDDVNQEEGVVDDQDTVRYVDQVYETETHAQQDNLRSGVDDAVNEELNVADNGRAMEKDFGEMSEGDTGQQGAAAKYKSKGRRACPECNCTLTSRVSLRKHLTFTNRPGSISLKCNICQLVLSTRCSLRMHLRIHMKLRPYRCPECAIEFHIYERYMMHLKYTCCHMSKCVRYFCSMCSFLDPTVEGLEHHMVRKHVRSIFKCGSCPVAFLNTRMIDRHKEKAHPDIKVDTIAYEQCRLCPDKLIPKKKFTEHIREHVRDEKFCIYAYECPKCKACFLQKTELIYHRMKCDTREGIIQSIISSPPPSPPPAPVDIEEIDLAEIGPSTSEISRINHVSIDDREVEEEEILISPAKKRLKVSSDDEVQILEKDPLSLEGFQAEEEPVKEPTIEKCVMCKKQRVFIQPGQNPSSQSLFCTDCVRPCSATDLLPKKPFMTTRNKTKTPNVYKCKICNSVTFVDLKSTFNHFKKVHKELVGSVNEFITVEQKNVFHSYRGSTFATAETIKEKYIKKKKSAAVVQSSPASLKEEEISDDESGAYAERKNIMIGSRKRFRGRQKLMVSDGVSFESGQLISPDKPQVNLNCAKCDYVAADISGLREHVTCHRTDLSALQCLECGECFVVLPSFEKHLFINHQITDVEAYVSENKDCCPQVEDDFGDESGEYKCSVCEATFDSQPSLDKHFRTHGMAFLLKRKL